MAPHSSTLAWKIPWMEEPGRLQSMGSLCLEHPDPSPILIHPKGVWEGLPWRRAEVLLPGRQPSLLMPTPRQAPLWSSASLGPPGSAMGPEF